MTYASYLTDLIYLCAIGAALYWRGFWLAVGVCEAVERAVARARGNDDDEA